MLAMLVSIVCPLVKRTRPCYNLTVLATAMLFIFSVIVAICTGLQGESFTYQLGHFPAPWGNELRAGVLEGIMAACFTGVMLLSLTGGHQDFESDIENGKQNLYFLMINLLSASLLAQVYTNDMFTGYVFLEISGIAACAVVMATQTGLAIACTIRYMIFNSLGSGLFLLGVAILYRCTGQLLMEPLHNAVMLLSAQGSMVWPMIVSLGLMTVGLAAKSGQFPFHSWLPGAHSNATTTSSAILSGLVLKGYIIFEIKIIVRVFSLELLRQWHLTDILFLFGVGGMIIASLRARKEEQAKRMIAFSTVAQIGYIYAALGLGTKLGIAAACFQVIAHAFTKTMLFASVGTLIDVSGHEKRLHYLRGSARRAPLAGAAFTLGGLSLCGLPLLAGFGAKYLIANASFYNRYLTVAMLLALAFSSLLNALYYLPAIINFWMPPLEDYPVVRSDRSRRFSLIAFMIVNVALGVWFVPIMNLLLHGIELL